MGTSFFITATDTDAGKTFVTALLVRALTKTGMKACALKPVCCGRAPGEINPDIKVLLPAQNLPNTQAEAINLYDFVATAAPGQAAMQEDRRIEPETLMQWCDAKTKAHDVTLIEGVGGLMAPLTEEFLVSDWLAAMPDCAVVLIVRARLGGINHALLTLKHLQLMGHDPAWVVLNDADNVGDTLVQHHVEAIVPYLKSGTRLLNLPHQSDILHTTFPSQLQPIITDIAQKHATIQSSVARTEQDLTTKT